MYPTTSANGKVTWQWQVPDFASPGQARVDRRLPGLRKATKSMIVVGGLIPAEGQGRQAGLLRARPRQTARTSATGSCCRTCRRTATRSTSAWLVNFVLPDNHLIGSASSQVPIINAGADLLPRRRDRLPGRSHDPAARGRESLPEAARSAKNFQPALDNVHLVPDLFDPAWLGSVEGDLINIHPTLALASSSMSCVIFDAQGKRAGRAARAAGTSSSCPVRARSSRCRAASTRSRSTRRLGVDLDHPVVQQPAAVAGQ